MNREYCPTCHAELDIYAEPRFCEICGWTDEDEEEEEEEDDDQSVLLVGFTTGQVMLDTNSITQPSFNLIRGTLIMTHETPDLDKVIATARQMYRLLVLLAKEKKAAEKKAAGNGEASEAVENETVNETAVGEIISILNHHGYPLFITHSRHMVDSVVDRIDFHTRINVLFRKCEYDAIILTLEDMCEQQ